MQLHELYQKIDLPEEAARRAKEAGRTLDLAALEPFLAGMMAIETAESAYRALSGRLTGDADHWAMLLCQLECARRDADRYRALGAGMDVFAATMKCFTRFLRECAVRNGRMFFDRGWWTYRQLSMRIFRLGALEYELREEGGAPCAGIHIPSDADLSPAAVDDSLAQAAAFFAARMPDFAYDRYTCSSWLLSPALRPFLRSDSNILSFQNRFEILREHPEDRAFSNGCSARRRTRISPACPKPPACRGTSSACCSPAEMWAARRASSGQPPSRAKEAIGVRMPQIPEGRTEGKCVSQRGTGSAPSLSSAAGHSPSGLRAVAGKPIRVPQKALAPVWPNDRGDFSEIRGFRRRPKEDAKGRPRIHSPNRAIGRTLVV